MANLYLKCAMFKQMFSTSCIVLYRLLHFLELPQFFVFCQAHQCGAFIQKNLHPSVIYSVYLSLTLILWLMWLLMLVSSLYTDCHSQFDHFHFAGVQNFVQTLQRRGQQVRLPPPPPPSPTSSHSIPSLVFLREWVIVLYGQATACVYTLFCMAFSQHIILFELLSIPTVQQ